ncbi:MAG: peptidoglycan-associated lipoprotein [Deltaproteobacteria bacterium RIFOXYD12_FULL_50_9]|nr:MAG: peptidoglycan-associated lipoprotein [Deltaproteobacteria bacterium RIFOXYD12_FULL_50_9]
MKKVISCLLVMMWIVSALLLISACSQKTVKTELDSPPASAPAPVPVTVPPVVERSVAEQRPIPQVKELPAVASVVEESRPQVEPLDTAPAIIVAQNSPTSVNEIAVHDIETTAGRSTGTLVPVFFDFDRASIKDDQTTRVESNAALMKKQAAIKIRIEGNCDERGTNEYNMALGERRAISLKKYMVDLGIDETRLETLSYGEERPLTLGHDEAAWALNRRGDFMVVN